METEGRKLWRGRLWAGMSLCMASVLTACVSEGEPGGGGGASVQSTKTQTTPTAVGLAVSPLTPLVTQESTFTVNCAGGTGALQYHWDFGDGSTSEQARPTHAFGSAKQYDVTLRCIDSLGNAATAKTQVTVLADIPPKAKISISPEGAKPIGEVLEFSAQASSEINDPLSYSWNFGDGSEVVSGADKSTTTHKYTKPGAYTATLTVSDQHGGQTQVTVTIGAGVPAFQQSPQGQTVRRANAVNFDALASEDGQVITYTWDFGDGSDVVTGRTPSHRYAANGSYRVTVTASDSHGGSSVSSATVVIVDNLPPSAPLISVPAQIDVNSQPTSMAVTTASIFGDTLTYVWDFGDGTTSTQASPSHIYDKAGQYTIKVTATDTLGGSASSSTTVFVGDFGSVVARQCTGPGGAGWCTQNPLPTNKPLRAIVRAGELSYWAVGDGGAVVHSTNGGFNWFADSSGTQNDLQAIAAVNPWVAWAVGASGTILKTSNAGANWSPKSSGTTANLSDIFAYSDQVLWVAGGALLSSTDGGETWAVNSLGAVSSVWVDSPEVIWAAKTTLRKSVDGGRTWTDTGIQSTKVLRLSGTLYAFSGSNVSKSTNDGQSWRSDTQFGAREINDIKVVDGKFVAIGNRQRIAESTDGVSWVIKWLDDGTGPDALHDLFGVVGSGQGLIFVGADAGLHALMGVGYRCSSLLTGTSLRLYSIVAQNDNVVYVFGGGTFVDNAAPGVMGVSVDGGHTWSFATDLPTGNIYDASSPAPGVFWVLARGGVYRSLSSGNGWAMVRSAAVRGAACKIKATSANNAWVHCGGINVTNDGGQTWVAGVDAVTDFVPVDAMVAYGVNGNQLFKTVDAGASWSLIYTAPSAMTQIGLAQDGTVWAIGDGGLSVRSTNARTSWVANKVSKLTTSGYLSPVNANIAWVVAGTTAYRTIDGGVTWSESTVQGAFGLAAVSDQTAWVIGDPFGLIQHTVTGGQ